MHGVARLRGSVSACKMPDCLISQSVIPSVAYAHAPSGAAHARPSNRGMSVRQSLPGGLGRYVNVVVNPNVREIFDVRPTIPSPCSCKKKILGILHSNLKVINFENFTIPVGFLGSTKPPRKIIHEIAH